MNFKSILKYIHFNLAVTFNLPYNFLGKKIWASKEKYLKIFNDAKNKKYLEIESFLKQYDFKIDPNWLDKLALHTQVVIKKNPINYQHGKIIYSILSNYLKNNEAEEFTILETGTSRGYSSIIMSKALSDQNKLGNVYTIDVIPHNKRMIWNSIDDHDGEKTRKELLRPWSNFLGRINFLHGKSTSVLKNLKLDRINFAFLDSEHKIKDLKKEFEYVSRRQKSGDIIFFDDYTPGLFDEVVNFVDEVKNHNLYKVKSIQSSNLRGYAIATKR